jgi:plastocyanin
MTASSKYPLFHCAITLLILYCNHKTGDEARKPVPAGMSQSVQVYMTEQRQFMPSQLAVRKGQTVRWVNISYDTHSVTADPLQARQKGSVILPEGALPFASGPMFFRDTFAYTFTISGRYRYFCRYHEMAGMIGEVHVQ